MIFSRYIKKLDRATKEKIRLRLAMAYAIIAWNGFAIGLYMLSNGRHETSDTPKGLTRVLDSNTEASKVIRIKGFNIVENTVYDKNKLDEIRHNINSHNNTPDDEDSDF
ncbi:uncharacterized protein LOC118446286 [Vespa mandarinia]|uniref:uncharacterized protein LOC118446286 n=1 Tax=Vespa mandarinia TaxID=7446 RepID=UPI0016168D9E|nr:uncharacterized protein LOC118446286 [Vespa mandarinia]XP_035732670.1 uncharacterized protein LOC118446286 [Vespa mandarinia]